MTEAARYSRTQVCELAGYGPQTLRRRILQGRMPRPVDRGREDLFDIRAVRSALGLDVPPAEDNDPFGTAISKVRPGYAENRSGVA